METIMTISTDIDLRHYIIGAWILESYESFDLDGSNVHYPLGSDARGIIMKPSAPDGAKGGELHRRPRNALTRLTSR